MRIISKWNVCIEISTTTATLAYRRKKMSESMKADHRIYHHRGWKGCALHTISFIFNIARTSTKNINETRLFNMLSSRSRIKQCKYLFGNGACPCHEEWAKKNNTTTKGIQRGFEKFNNSRNMCIERIKSGARFDAMRNCRTFLLKILYCLTSFRPLWFGLKLI